MRGSGATTALPALCATWKWDALEHISLLFFSPLPSPLSSFRLQILWFFVKTLFYFILFVLFFWPIFWLSINMEWEHRRPARCHRCYWSAYYTKKSAPVIKCHSPQKMYHPPFSPLPPLLFFHPNPLLLHIYCIWFLISSIFKLYFIWSWVDLASHRQDLLWCVSLTWHDGTWHDVAVAFWKLMTAPKGLACSTDGDEAV